MAEGKKGFVLYADQKFIFDDLSNEEAGILIKHIFSYVNDENPILEDRIIQMAFNPIKMQLKRDLVKYENVRERNSLNARKRWDAVALSGIPNNTKNADIDKDKDKDIVKDIVKDISIIKVKLRDLVSISPKEHETLKLTFTENDCNWMYDKLNNYKLASGKTYKSDYGAINSWVKEELKKQKLVNPTKKATKEL